MITFELITFIKKHLEKETPIETIKDLLRHRGGWYDADIEEAFTVARHGHYVDEIDE
mgnify:CR=1 FL=1